MNLYNVNIFGSCVSRDVVEFASGLGVGKYCARQSVVSAVAQQPRQETVESLRIVEGTHPFHERCVREDFEKSGLNSLADRPAGEAIIVDFIEERMPLGETECGTLVSLSQTAAKISNARSIVARQIGAYTEEHIGLFSKAIVKFAARLNGRNVLLHRALYAPGEWEYEHANHALNVFYSMANEHLKPIAVIDVPDELRVSAPNHKWGLAPYHYIDNYYVSLVSQISDAMRIPVKPKNGFSLQKLSGEHAKVAS